MENLEVDSLWTPGPYEVRGSGLITDRHGVTVATVEASNAFGINRDWQEGRKDWNTRLLASAPDLVKELKALVDRCDGAQGVREDGSNIDTSAAHAMLAKLGLRY